MEYKKLGFNSFESYFNELTETLLQTNKTYDYFVNWNKVHNNVDKYRIELSLLNSLRNEGKKEIKQKFKELARQYPNVIRVIPALVAERVSRGELYLLEEDFHTITKIDFNSNEYTKQELQLITKFCDKTGIFEVIRSVKDLTDYLLGVEVGIDTNGRKGRSGKIFEKMVNDLLVKTLGKRYIINWNTDNFSIYRTSRGKKINRHDFVLRDRQTNDVKAVIEVNFYNTQGSKPDSIVGNYINMNVEARRLGIKFIWITDGPRWRSNQDYLRKGAEEIDWLLNYRLAKARISRIL